MAENSKIEWTDHTFNPWRGCTKVAAGCTNCYAETMARRFDGKHGIWGDQGTRVVASEAMWRKPLKWNEVAMLMRGLDERLPRPRVFCASMADVFEDRPELVEPRHRLFKLIEATPELDWILLTKRPENVDGMAWVKWDHNWPANVWLGTSVACQEDADRNLIYLRDIPAAVRFVSYEPGVGGVDWRRVYAGNMNVNALDWLDWIIVGGESGPKARPFDVAWARSTIEQCKDAGVACFVKQLGAKPLDRNDAGFSCMDDVWADGPDAGMPTDPGAWPAPRDVDWAPFGSEERHQGALVRPILRDPKGGDWNEWPSDLRVREFPEAQK